MTPTQHKAAAETLLAQIEASPATHGDLVFARARAHALLSATSGSGSAYTSADTLLAAIETDGQVASIKDARVAIGYALLASTLGTGTHNASAQGLLTNAAASRSATKNLEIAHLHALLADR